MTAENLVAFNLLLAAAIVSPGPALLYMLRVSVRDGRGAGVRTGFGLGLAAAFWTLAALLGVEAVFTLVPWAYGTLRFIGGAYLIWLAWGMWRGAGTAPGEAAEARSRSHLLSGVLINLANPKSVLFAAAVLVVVFPKGLNAGEIALIVFNHFAVEAMFYLGFATLLGSSPARRLYLDTKSAIDRTCAGLMAALGLKLLLDR
ncbi:MAG: LysE family translocator [Rhodobacteraceae bacterium]|nr:LysE family translocator [Paracoccaceae bacterium]